MAKERRTRQPRWLQNLKKLVRKVLQWLRLQQSYSQAQDTPSTPRHTTTSSAQQEKTQQTVGNVDHGSVAVGSIANVQGDVYIGVRPITGIPFQVPPLPSFYVDRTEARERLKRNLLKEGTALNTTLVVSAVYGLGGIGKSVLATALALDEEVQKRFPDGVLWATLGQQPEVLAFLGNWIQALRDFDYKPTTIEAASTHLRSLLYNKRMLLVVDDVWKSEDAEWFRIGGVGCRILVTTREAHIPGAERIDLEQMEPDEAILLIEGYLRNTLIAKERELALEFADAVGYLPLALELAAVQIHDGESWTKLLVAFKEEVARLEVLDAPDLEEVTTEKARKQRSLRASFKLSLQSLKKEFLQRFAEMGVLPEDVNVGVAAMATIWNVSLETAQKTLRELRRRSLLLDGVAWNEQLTYRMHDLMHDTARFLLKDLSDETLAAAHRQVLDRYRSLTSEGRWWALSPDGYIHSNLTWHMEQAGLADEIHTLLQASDRRGRNAWFEACHRLGQPTIFVQDVARGWRLADAIDSKEQERAILLQVRYALIVTTLNSLASNLPAPLLATLVRRKLWTLEQSWAYVSRDQSPKNLTFTLIELSPLLSKSYWQQVLIIPRHLYYFSYFLEKSISFLPADLSDELLKIISQLESNEEWSDLIRVLSILSDSIYIDKIIQALKKSDNKIKDINFLIRESNEFFLRSLAEKLFDAFIPGLNNLERAEIIAELANRFSIYFPKAIKSIEKINDPYSRAKLFIILCKKNRSKDILLNTLSEISNVRNRHERIKLLISWTQYTSSSIQEINVFDNVFDQVKSLKNTNDYIPYLISLSEIFPELTPELIEEARSIQNESTRSTIITKSKSSINEGNINDFLDLAYSLNMKSARNRSLSHLSSFCTPDRVFSILDNVLKIEDIRDRALAILKILHPDSHYRMYPLIESLKSDEDYAEVVSFFLTRTKSIPESILKSIIDRVLIIEIERAKLTILKSMISHLNEDTLLLIEFTPDYFSTYLSTAAFYSILFQIRRDPMYIQEAINATMEIDSPVAKKTSFVEIIPLFDEIITLENLRNLSFGDINIPKNLIFLHAAKFRSQKIIYLIEDILAEQDLNEQDLSLVDLVMIYVELYKTTQLNKYLKKALVEISITENSVEKVNAMLHLLPVKPMIYQILEIISTLRSEDERLLAISALFEAYPYLNSKVYDVIFELNLFDDLIKGSNISSLIGLIQHNTQLMNELIFIYGGLGKYEARKQFLSDVAPYLLDYSSFVAWFSSVSNFSDNMDRAYLCGKLLERQKNNLARSYCIDYTSFRKILHFLAHSERKVFLRNLPNLIPFIQNFGSENTNNIQIQEITRVVEEVCEQWK